MGSILKNILSNALKYTPENGSVCICACEEGNTWSIEEMCIRDRKIHSGRSRNDQVLLDLKLFTRTQIREIAEAVEPVS